VNAKHGNTKLVKVTARATATNPTLFFKTAFLLSNA